MALRLQDFARSIVETLRAHSFEAYWVGGCVRDRLMGIESKDIDICTSALPDDIRRIFARTVPVGEAFNVMLVVSPDEDQPLTVEVASFRKDVGISDGRHPAAITTATAQEDVERRDFTINGMLYDPLTDRVLDWVGGQKDLEAKMIRSIGPAKLRLREDYLRILRAVRFGSRLGFKIDDELKAAVIQEREGLRQISAERIFEEITRMLTEGRARFAFELLDELRILEIVLPELLPMKGCEQPPEHHPEGDVWIHTLLLLEQLTPAHSAELGWGCLLHDVGKPPTFSHQPPDRIRFNGHAQVGAQMTETILRRLKASRSLIDIVVELVDQHLRFADVKNMKPSTLKRFLRNPNFALHLEQHRIDCKASHGKLEIYEFCKTALASFKEEELRPAPLLRGADLLTLGYPAGRLFKEILTEVETAQLEGRLNTKEEAKDFVLQKWKL
jgi:poly(A) polymerase